MRRKHMKDPAQVLLNEVDHERNINKENPMVDYQKSVGELLRHPKPTVQANALTTLVDLVNRSPIEADPEAVRRMGKYFLYGSTAQEAQFKTPKLMTEVVGTLHAYADAKGDLLEWEERVILNRVADKAPEYGVSPVKAKNLKKAVTGLAIAS